MLGIYLIPVILQIICILVPSVYGWNYLATTLIFFWAPSFVLGSQVIKRALHRWKPILLLYLIIVPLTLFTEWFSVDVFTIWTFDPSTLIGINLFGYPVEEFVWWWSSPIYLIMVYLYYEKQNEIETEPGMAVYSLGFYNNLFCALSRDKIKLNTKALLWTIATFGIPMFLMDINAVIHGHWIYILIDGEFNIMGIPWSEFLYYPLGPIFTVFLFLFLSQRVKY